MKRWVVICWLVSCHRVAKPQVQTADEIVSVYAKVAFGASLADAKVSLPKLQPSGWSRGSQATWLSVDEGVELEIDADKVTGVSVSFGPDRGADAERKLRDRLGEGVECTTLPEGIASFRPTLWRLSDGGAVMLVRKQRVLELHVAKPASPAFEAAWTSCQGR